MYYILSQGTIKLTVIRNDIYKNIYEQLKENKEVCIEFQLRADNVKWEDDDIVLSSGEIISLEDYVEELEADISKLLSNVIEKTYSDFQDSSEILVTIRLKKNCLLEFIGLGMSLYKEMSNMELGIAATLLSTFVGGFLGLGFYRVKKNFESAKYAADKQVETAQEEVKVAQIENETSRINLKTAEIGLKTQGLRIRELEIQERLANASQQVHAIGQDHLQKLSQNLGTKNITAPSEQVKTEDVKLTKEVRKYLHAIIKTGADIEDYLQNHILDKQKRASIRESLMLKIDLMTEKKLKMYGLTVDDWNNYWDMRDTLSNSNDDNNPSM